MEIIEPDLAIVDAHHHLWFLSEALLAGLEAQQSIAAGSLAPLFRRCQRYLLDEYLEDLHSGHNVLATVHVDACSMYRSRGPEELKSTGEVEFVNGVAAMSASGRFGPVQVCAGIVGGVDLTLGDGIREVLEAHVRAGGQRYRGVRSSVVFDPDPNILGQGVGAPHVLGNRNFRRGFSWLQKFGLSFDAWVFEPQLPELVELAYAFPDTTIILNHVGTPLGVGAYKGQRDARFASWRNGIRQLASCENVVVKLGGLGIPFGGFSSYLSSPPATSEQLAEEWRPYIETCIEAFGARRCMFISNFPVDSASCSYATLWNVFKRIVAGGSRDEKQALFSETAVRVYRLDL